MTSVNDGELFSGGWSPQMDYPSDSVMALSSTLVELFHEKNGICFRCFLNVIYLSKWSVPSLANICAFSLFLRGVGWVWLPSTCKSNGGLILAAPDLSWHECLSNVASRKDAVFCLTVRLLAILAKFICVCICFCQKVRLLCNATRMYAVAVSVCWLVYQCAFVCVWVCGVWMCLSVVCVVCAVWSGESLLTVFAVWRRFSSSPIRCSSVGLCFTVYLLVCLFALNWAGLVKKKKNLGCG